MIVEKNIHDMFDYLILMEERTHSVYQTAEKLLHVTDKGVDVVSV